MTRTAPWAAFQYRELVVPRSRACKFVTSVPALPEGDAEVRLLFELQPDGADYYFVSVTRERLVLGKVECRVEMVLAEWRGAGGAAEAPFARDRKVGVVRTPGRIDVTVGTRRVIQVSDDTFTQGRAAIGCRGLAGGTSPSVEAFPVGEIYAADDFMRTKEDEAAWRVVSGTWAVEWQENPGLSANAFVYGGRPTAKEPGIVLLGEPWWDDYSFEVSMRPNGLAGFGLIFRYVDESNYYVFRFAGAERGRYELVRVFEGKETALAGAKAVPMAGQWYRLGITACGTYIAGYVDGNLVCQARDDALAFGEVGLFIADLAGSQFDDVFVRGERGVMGDFGDGVLAWYRKGGSWNIEKSGTTSRLRAKGTGPVGAGKLLGGEDTWTDYSVSTTVAPGSIGRAGIITRYRDEMHLDEFIYDIGAGKYELAIVRDGRRTVVSEVPARPLLASRTLSVHLAGGVISCEAGGERLLSYFDNTFAPGKPGLCVGSGSEVLFENLSVSFPREAEPVLTQLDTFAREDTMANWAAAESDWREESTDLFGRRRVVRWHRAAFPGGGEVRVSGFFDPSRPGALRLFTGWDIVGTEARHGYELVVRSLGPGSEFGKVELLRDGREVATRDIPAPRGKTRILFRRISDYVIADMNDRPELAWKDPAPLAGQSSGYAAENVLVKPEDVDIFCSNTLSYSFAKAACDWRSAGGKWEIANRWRCDPRWSFFLGESLTGVACIWNKTMLSGDVTVEFAASIRHQGSGGSGYARHAANLNAVICGDGRSLSSGYGFIYGGWANSRTAITREGQLVAESQHTIPADIHRRWFLFKVVKRGAELAYYIDNRPVLKFTDPAPLKGGQVALWTWQNGMVIARVRIAAEQVGAKERWDVAFPSVSKCIYD